jgi:hypothetical protein
MARPHHISSPGAGPGAAAAPCLARMSEAIDWRALLQPLGSPPLQRSPRATALGGGRRGRRAATRTRLAGPPQVTLGLLCSMGINAPLTYSLGDTTMTCGSTEERCLLLLSKPPVVEGWLVPPSAAL